MATDIIISTDKTSQQVFPGGDHRMIVAAGIFVRDGSFTTVYSNAVKSTLLNQGLIISGLSGVLFDAGADLGRVQNAAGALIQGYAGVEMLGARSTVVNAGAIVGLSDVGVRMDGVTKASVTNSGTIRGSLYGVSFEGGGGLEGDTVVNSGVLRGGSIAVRSILEPGATLTVTNQAKGLIAGPAAFSVNGGKLALTNHGKILGDVYDDVGLRTTVRNDGIIEGTTVLGGGNDSFNGSGGVQGRVYGGTGTDTLVGGSKGDWLDGGSDRDVLTGGGGADRFHFTQSSHSAPGATRDFITDFSRGQKDRIDIGDMAPFNFVFRGKQDFTGGGTPSVKYTQVNKAGTAKDRTIVHGDANGDGVADFQIELRGLVSLQASDFVL